MEKEIDERYKRIATRLRKEIVEELHCIWRDAQRKEICEELHCLWRDYYRKLTLDKIRRPRNLKVVRRPSPSRVSYLHARVLYELQQKPKLKPTNKHPNKSSTQKEEITERKQTPRRREVPQLVVSKSPSDDQELLINEESRTSRCNENREDTTKNRVLVRERATNEEETV